MAPTAASVLITGENGTGKELVARAIHYHSPRADRPFVEVNCAAIPEDLIESELFGHEKGAFTGAISRQHRASSSWPTAAPCSWTRSATCASGTQAKILRVLQEQRFERVGGSRAHHGGRAGDRRHQQGPGRGDRHGERSGRTSTTASTSSPFHVPPLRERREDIPLLVQHFLGELARENQAPPKILTTRALEALKARSWPGNVRELKNFIWRVSVLTLSPVIDAGDLPRERDLGTYAGGVGTLLSLPDFRDARPASSGST